MTIEVKSVTKVLRKITVLEDVNLILESGTIYGYGVSMVPERPC